MMTTDYTVRLDAFEGPMDLLMHLIEKNKIDIYDIPIAELTEQYLAYLDRFQEFNIEIASTFLVMAATLLQIKSRMMLPKAPQETDEEEGDPRQELIDQILEYRRFKEVSGVLDEMAKEQEHFFSRPPFPLPTKHLPPDHLSLEALIEAFQLALEVHEEVTLPAALVVREEYSVQDKMMEISTRLKHAGGRMLFSEIFHSGVREELIASFLALLELIRRKQVNVRQQQLFSDIYISIRDGEMKCI